MWFYVIKDGIRNYIKSSTLFETSKQAENEARAYCEKAFAIYGVIYSYFIDINLDGRL